VLGLNGIWALVLGNDDLLLAQWSEAVICAGDGTEMMSAGELSISVKYSPYPSESVRTSWW